MSTAADPRRLLQVRARRWLGAIGSMLASVAVALAAYAAHGADGEAQARLTQAAAFAFGACDRVRRHAQQCWHCDDGSQDPWR